MTQSVGAVLPPSTEDGWRTHDLPGLMGLFGPLLTKRDGDQWIYAIRVRSEHLNQAQAVHGGAVTTLMDQALSTIAWDRAGRTPCVTVQLNISFLGSSRLGQLLTARGNVTRETGTLLFLDGTLHADDKLVGTAQAIMKRVKS